MSKLQVVRREERNAVQSFLDVRNFFLVRANLQLKLYATEQKERPTMDLSQITNTDISFSLATMEDILARYNAQTEGSTSTANKTPASVKTAISALRQAYARVHGDKPDVFGDLTWLTLDRLKKPSKFATARPLFQGAQHPSASETMSVPLEAATLRKNVQNFRSILYSASQHLKTINMADSDRNALQKKYSTAYAEFGKLAAELKLAEEKRVATREPSQRQQSKWVSWPELKKLEKTVVQSLDATFRSAPTTMNVSANKRMQRSLQFVMYTLLPPVRGGNYAGLRFIAPDQETMEVLSETNSPNYIVVQDDGSMELVFNKYKMDGRSKAMDYDPDTDFAINTDATKRFPLVANATLTKFGFDPVKLGALLANYRSLQQSLLGDKNPHELVFFELKRGDRPTVLVSPEGLSTRMARVTQRLTGQTLGATMLRTIFVSWLNDRKPKPTMPQREVIAEWMMHGVQTQLGTYTKSTQKRTPRTLEGSGKRRRVTVKNMRI
jgi:hypothetical protein